MRLLPVKEQGRCGDSTSRFPRRFTFSTFTLFALAAMGECWRKCRHSLLLFCFDGVFEVKVYRMSRAGSSLTTSLILNISVSATGETVNESGAGTR